MVNASNSPEAGGMGTQSSERMENSTLTLHIDIVSSSSRLLLAYKEGGMPGYINAAKNVFASLSNLHQNLKSSFPELEMIWLGDAITFSLSSHKFEEVNRCMMDFIAKNNIGDLRYSCGNEVIHESKLLYVNKDIPSANVEPAPEQVTIIFKSEEHKDLNDMYVLLASFRIANVSYDFEKGWFWMSLDESTLPFGQKIFTVVNELMKNGYVGISFGGAIRVGDKDNFFSPTAIKLAKEMHKRIIDRTIKPGIYAIDVRVPDNFDIHRELDSIYRLTPASSLRLVEGIVTNLPHFLQLDVWQFWVDRAGTGINNLISGIYPENGFTSVQLVNIYNLIDSLDAIEDKSGYKARILLAIVMGDGYIKVNPDLFNALGLNTLFSLDSRYKLTLNNTTHLNLDEIRVLINSNELQTRLEDIVNKILLSIQERTRSLDEIEVVLEHGFDYRLQSSAYRLYEILKLTDSTNERLKARYLLITCLSRLNQGRSVKSYVQDLLQLMSRKFMHETINPTERDSIINLIFAYENFYHQGRLKVSMGLLNSINQSRLPIQMQIIFNEASFSFKDLQTKTSELYSLARKEFLFTDNSGENIANIIAISRNWKILTECKGEKGDISPDYSSIVDLLRNMNSILNTYEENGERLDIWVVAKLRNIILDITNYLISSYLSEQYKDDKVLEVINLDLVDQISTIVQNPIVPDYQRAMMIINWVNTLAMKTMADSDLDISPDFILTQLETALKLAPNNKLIVASVISILVNLVGYLNLYTYIIVDEGGYYNLDNVKHLVLGYINAVSYLINNYSRSIVAGLPLHFSEMIDGMKQLMNTLGEEVFGFECDTETTETIQEISESIKFALQGLKDVIDVQQKSISTIDLGYRSEIQQRIQESELFVSAVESMLNKNGD